MSRSQLRAREQKSTGKTRDVLFCRTYSLIVLLSWFATERRSLKAKLSAQHVLRAFFTATIEGDFQGAVVLDAALSNEETCEQKSDLRTCQHVQEIRRSLFAEISSSMFCADACVKLMRLLIVRFWCQTACQRFLEVIANKVDAGLPEREFSSEPLDNDGSAPREGTRVTCGRGSQAAAHELNLREELGSFGSADSSREAHRWQASA